MILPTAPTLALYLPGGVEWIVILVIALLLFGKRLPEVGKSLGKGIVEFKRGLKGAREEVDAIDREVEDASAHDPKPLTGSAGDPLDAHAARERERRDKTEA